MGEDWNQLPPLARETPSILPSLAQDMAIIMDKGSVAPSPPKIEATLEIHDTKEGEYVQFACR